MDTSPNRLDFGRVGPELDLLVRQTSEELARSWPRKWLDAEFAQPYLRGSLLLTENTFGAIRLLCVERDKPWRAIAVAPLARTILDSVFNTVLLFEDLPNQWLKFVKSGWREDAEDLERQQMAHGDDPEFADWLRGRRSLNGYLEERARLTPEEIADPRRIPWWPNPGKMSRVAAGERGAYLRYLNDWFYRELSAQSHLSIPGMAMRAGALLGPNGPDRNALLDKSLSNDMFTTVCLVMAHVSEFESEFAWGFSARLRSLWLTMADYWPAANSLWVLRYRGLLTV